MAVKKKTTLRRRSSGFGGGLGYALIRAKKSKGGGRGTTLTPTKPPAGIQPQATPIPTSGNIDYSGAGSLSGGTGSYDLGSDPAVAAAAGLSAKARALAQATALAKRKQAAIEYGDPTGVEGIDEETAKAARENPFSVLKNLSRSYETGRENLEEGLNAANLFYSGYRGKQLGEAATNYEQSRYGAGTAFRGLMSDVGTSLADALLQADYMDMQAALNSQGGYYGGDGGGYDSGGDGGVERAISPDYRASMGLRSGSGTVYGTPTNVKKRPQASKGFGGGLGYALTNRGRY